MMNIMYEASAVCIYLASPHCMRQEYVKSFIQGSRCIYFIDTLFRC